MSRTVLATFAARFARRCGRCGVRIKTGHLVARLVNGEQVCLACAARPETVGWQRDRR